MESSNAGVVPECASVPSTVVMLNAASRSICVLHLLGNLISLDVLRPGLGQEPDAPQAPRAGQLDIQVLGRDLIGGLVAVGRDRLARTKGFQPHVVERPRPYLEVRSGEGCGAGEAPPA